LNESTQPHRTLPLALGALGVVYGDIGTSPLYALRECVHGTPAADLAARALGSASLILWALTLLVTLKYLFVVLRADNHGEGGILALMALATRSAQATPRLLLVLGVFGAALLYGDGILTPAVTVLGALEGLGEAWPAASGLIVPAAIAILIGIFSIQRHGTSFVGAWFGPVMVLWFVTLAGLGFTSIAQTPSVLAALNPMVALRHITSGGPGSIALLGSVFLAVTGAEALYADLGHFGRRPIRVAWLNLVFPALALNYLGQAALLIRDPDAAANPFYRLAPATLQIPLLILATAASIVASQALISGAFSLTMQALQLGFLPRLNIQHTSAHQRGQIFIGAVNTILATGCILLVLAFERSSELAAAYGVAVSLTMVLTTLLLGAIARHQWHWSIPRCTLVIGAFLAIDLTFLGANLLKFLDGGWLPLLFGSLLFTAMMTWHRGRATLARRLRSRSITLDDFISQVQTSTSVRRVPGTAVFLSASPDGTPVALLHNLKHNHVVHQRVVVLRFEATSRPHSEPADRLEITPLPAGFWRVTARFGFMEEPSLAAIQPQCALHGLAWDDMDTTYFLGREAMVAARHPLLPRWQSSLFRILSRNAQQPAAFYRLPPNRVVELGVQVEI
jgi:KUP system potassium uptake protein